MLRLCSTLTPSRTKTGRRAIFEPFSGDLMWRTRCVVRREHRWRNTTRTVRSRARSSLSARTSRLRKEATDSACAYSDTRISISVHFLASTLCNRYNSSTGCAPTLNSTPWERRIVSRQSVRVTLPARVLQEGAQHLAARLYAMSGEGCVDCGSDGRAPAVAGGRRRPAGSVRGLPSSIR